MFGGKNRYFNSNFEKVIEVKTAKDLINEKKVKIDSQEEKSKQIEKINDSINKINYMFGTQNDVVINNASSVILSNTGSKRGGKRSSQEKKESMNIKKSLEILNEADFFSTLANVQSGEKLMLDTVDLHHKRMRNVRSVVPVPTLENVYNNFKSLRNKEGALLIGFDTETMGDITGKAWSPQGMTEFAMVIDNMTTKETKEVNIALTSAGSGINHKDNLTKIENILSQKNGLEILKQNKDLLIAAERYSMYGHEDTKIEFNNKDGFGYSQVLSFGGNEAKRPGDIEAIRRGYEKLTKDIDKVVINENTGLSQDVSEVLKYTHFMAQQSHAKNAMVVNFNGQAFDVPVINKFVKGVYEQQLNVIRKGDKSSNEYNNAIKAVRYMTGMFGNSPSLNLNEDYVIDAFAITRTANDIFGENTIYSGTKTGKKFLPNVGNHSNRQENIAMAFYGEMLQAGKAHTGIHDTRVLNSFFLRNMENSQYEMPLIDWLMEGVNGEGILGKTNSIKSNKVNSGQVYMATQGDPNYSDGKKIFNFIQDSNGRIVTSSNHIIDTDGTIFYDKILNENPRIFRNDFYSIKSAQKVDMSNISPMLSQLTPEYGLNNLYHVQLAAMHGDKYKGTSNESTLNMIFNSQKEMEAWLASNFSLIGETSQEDGKFRLNPDAIDDYQIRQIKSNKANLSGFYNNKNSDLAKFQHLLNVVEGDTIDRRVVNSFLYGDKALSRVSATLDLHDFLKKNKLDNLSSAGLAKLYFDDTYAAQLGVEPKVLKEFKKNLNKNLGFEKKVNGEKRVVTLDSTVRNALFAYENVKQQEQYYSNLIKYSYEKNGITFNDKRSWSDNFKELSKDKKDMMFNTYEYVMDESNRYIALSTGQKKGEQIRNVLINGKNRLESTSQIKSNYDFKLNKGFYESKNAAKIKNFRKSDLNENIVTFNLDRENPRNSFINTLLKAKFDDNYKDFSEAELIKHRKATFLDFVNNISQDSNPDIFDNENFMLMKNNISSNKSSFSLEDNLDLLQLAITQAKDKNIDAGILRSNTITSSKVSKDIAKLRNNVSMDEMRRLGKNAPTYKNLNGTKKNINKEINNLLNNFLMPNKKDFLNGSYKTSIEKKAGSILYDNVREQMKGALEEIFEAAGIAQAYIHYDVTKGNLNLIKGDEVIALSDLPKIVQNQGTLFAKSGNQVFQLKHVVDTVDTPEGKKVKVRTNLDEAFGKKGVLSNRVKRAVDDESFTLDKFKREIGYTKLGFAESSSVTRYTMADLRTGNNTVDYRNADPILSEFFGTDGKFKPKIVDLLLQDELNTPNTIKKLEDSIRNREFKPGELPASLRMLLGADVSTILNKVSYDEDTSFILQSSNSLGKETRVTEGNRFIGNNIFPTIMSGGDNYAKPTLVSSENSMWIKSNTVEHTKKNYEGLLISGPVINSKEIMENIYIHVEETGMDYQNSFGHRQLYTGVLGVNDIVNKEQERVISNLTHKGMKKKEIEEVRKTYSRAALKVRDSLFEQAKIFDPVLFEGTFGQIPQDVKRIGNALDVITAVNELRDTDDGMDKLLKRTRINEMIDAAGSISVDKNGILSYKKGKGTIVKSGELLLPYKTYSGQVDYVSSPFAKGTLGFAIRDEFGNELTEKEINKILNDNVGYQSFGKSAIEDMKNFISVFEHNDKYKIGYEIENINKIESAKTFDNYAEKSMTNLFYAKTGEFDKNIEKYFKATGGNDMLYHTVLTDKALDSYINDVEVKFGKEKAQKLLEEAGLSSIKDLKEKVKAEQLTYRNIIFGPNGIFQNISGIANDDLIKHKNEGARISSTIGQAISLVGKYQNGGIENSDTYQVGLTTVLDFINKGNGKYDFLSSTTKGNIKGKREQYTMNDFALLFTANLQTDDEFTFVDVEKAKNLIKDIDSTFLSKADDKDRLVHKNVKVYKGNNEYDTVDEFYGNLHFYMNENNEKVAIGSVGVVSKNHAIDSEFQSNVSKEYLDRKRYIQKLKSQKEDLLKERSSSPEEDEKRLLRLEQIDSKIDDEMAVVNSMKSYSRHMKIDDQARNILSNSELNGTTEKHLDKIISGKNKEHYSNLLYEATSGLIRNEDGNVVISDAVRTSNANQKLIDEIKGQITYNPLEEDLITKDMIRTKKYSKYKGLYEHTQSMGLQLGTEHAELLYEGIQANKAAQFNVSNAVSRETLINDYGFKHIDIEDYVATRGRGDNAVLESYVHQSLMVDLGDEFADKRYIAVPALGKISGDKEINQPWHQTLSNLNKTFKKYQKLEGMDSKEADYFKQNILDLSDLIREQTNDLVKKGQVIANLSKVEVNMPYSRVKLMSTISEELIQSPLTEEMKRNNKLVNNIDSASFRNKAMINGKTIAEWEKGGIEGGGIFYDYRTAGEVEFRNAGYFEDKFLTEVMGFEKYKDENGKTVDIYEQMRRHLETNGTMDIVDRYPNIKDTSLYTGMTFLDRSIGDNVTAVAAHSLLKLNGDSDGDMVSTLFLDYKGTNFVAYNKFRTDAEKNINKTVRLSDEGITPEDYEGRIRKETVRISKGKVSDDAYELFRGKQIEMVHRAAENVENVKENLMPILFKESKRNYKNMALATVEGDDVLNLEAEVVGGKSILGKVKLFNQDKHVSSGFFVNNNKEISEYMEKAYDIFQNSGLIENKDDFKYIGKMDEMTNIHSFNTEQSQALDEVLSVFETAKKNGSNLVSNREYDQVEKSVMSRIRANTYIQAEISKSGKESIGQINAVLYPLRQASEEKFGREKIKGELNDSYNPLARQIISDMSEQIEQNVISYKKVEAVAGDERLINFIDIMNEAKVNKVFNTLPGESQDKLIAWNQQYLKDDVIEGMYKNLEDKALLTDKLRNSQQEHFNKFIGEGMSNSQASSASKAIVLTQEYTKYIDEIYGSESGRANINLYSNHGRSAGTVQKAKSVEYASADSFIGTTQALITESPIGRVSKNDNNYRTLEELNNYKNTLANSVDGKAIATKVMKDTADIFDSANSMGIAMGVIGLASGLLISGFASGNPLKNPQQEQSEISPKAQAMSVPDFFDKQGGYVTGNSQNGYIVNVKADTKKGQRHMKRALKQAVTSSTGGAVSINMNFKSNNSGGYSDQDIEKLINSYI